MRELMIVSNISRMTFSTFLIKSAHDENEMK